VHFGVSAMIFLVKCVEDKVAHESASVSRTITSIIVRSQDHDFVGPKIASGPWTHTNASTPTLRASN
jgi:hypothetical protein